jgi:nickel-dependent lactate racemase
MIVEIAYGRGALAVNLPQDAEVTVIRKNRLTKLRHPRAAVVRALNNPIGSPPLAELARGRRSACILICDVTRPAPNHLFLRPLIVELLRVGVPADRITVLVATGLHRPNLGSELEELVGDPWVLANVQVVNHTARCDADHVDLGRTTGRGTPVKIDRRFVEADLRIATGLVEPHFMAGYSGGPKVVAPGVAHADTIRTFHSARFMEDSGARQCNLQGNPLREEQLEIVGMIGEIYGLNVVLDESRDLCQVCFGEIVASHLAAVDFARHSAEVPVSRRFKTVVTCAAGHPLDKTYYQTVKGMVAPMDILEPGADLIVASACSEGLGSKEFRAAQRRLLELGAEAFLEGLKRKTLADIDEWQTEMQLKPMCRARIALYTQGLSEDDRRLTGVNLVSSLEQAVQESFERNAVIPEGPYVVPFYAPSKAQRASKTRP